MIEINLLPWREIHRRRRWHKILWCGLFILLLLLAVNAPHSFPAPSHGTIMKTSLDQADLTSVQRKLHQIKFVGFVRQGERAWGLLLFGNGETHEVSVGSVIPGTHAHIMQVTQQQIVISDGHKNIYTLVMMN